MSDAEAAKGSGPSRVYEGSYETVWIGLLESVRVVGLELVAENKDKGTILAQGKAGGFTWGENVAIFAEDAKGATRVEIVNKRAVATNVTARDWDKTLFAELDKRFRAREGQARPGGLTEPQRAAPPLAAAALAPAAGGMPARGTRWRYKYRDEQYRGAERVFTVEIVSVEGFLVKERLIVEEGDISEALVIGDQLRFMARPISSQASVLEFAPYAPALYNRVAAAPGGYPSTASLVWRVGKPTYAEDRITVPAGTFAALRVEIEGTSPAFGGAGFAQPARFVYTAWYSPERKRYIKARHRVWSRIGPPIGDEVVELVGYEAGK